MGENGRWTRVDDSARMVAEELGLATGPEDLADRAVRHAIAERLAEVAVDQILGAPLDRLGTTLQLTEPLPRSTAPTRITFSGGVSEYIFKHEEREFGDIAKPLASQILSLLNRRSDLPLSDPGNRIRATVIGGIAIHRAGQRQDQIPAEPDVLPVHNVPVLHGCRTNGEIDGDTIFKTIGEAVADGSRPQARLLSRSPGRRSGTLA
jgi:ethanolamine utilization protein EutA